MSRILKWIIFPFMAPDRSLFLGGFVICQSTGSSWSGNKFGCFFRNSCVRQFFPETFQATCVRMLFSTKRLDLHDEYTNSLGGFVAFTSKLKSLRYYCRVCQHGVIKITEWTCSRNILLNTRRIRQNGEKA